MYDIITTTLLFVLLAPGFIVTLPPSGGVTAYIIHAIVFYVVQSFLTIYVPSWGIWIIFVGAIGIKMFMNRSPSVTTY